MSCNTCNPCEEPICSCAVEIDAKCVTVTGEFECSSIESGLSLNQFLEELDAFICTKFNELAGYFALVNVGNGAKIYAGINGIGQKKIRSLTSLNASVEIIENTDTLDLSVNFPPGVDQNNIVKNIAIEVTDLPANYSKSNIISYILSLPVGERTILETTSKLNIIIGSFTDGYIVIKVFELQNQGKGIITSISSNDLLEITPALQGFQDVLTVNSILPLSNNITVETDLTISSGVSPTNGITIRDESLASTSTPIIQLGAGLGNTGTDRSINYYTDRTEVNDGLNQKGLENAGDYEANFTDRSLITKQFFDDNIPIVDGSETKLNSGTNISITGTGTVSTPYVINNTLSVDGSETKINNGTTTTVTGTGTIASPYTVETVNLQKAITSDYTLTPADNNYSIKVNNASTPITITVPIGLPSAFFAGFTQKGSGDVTFTGSGSTITNPVGLKIKGQGYHVGLEQIGTTNTFDLLGFTKA